MIDTHAHLQDKRLFEDLEGVTKRAKLNGVTKIINVGYDLSSSERGKELAEKYSFMYFTAGAHPDVSSEVDEKYIESLEKLATDEKCLAIGEIGLDYHYEGYDKEAQKRAFQMQIDLADKLNLPSVIHTRDAFKDTLDFVSDNVDKLKNGYLLHCYGGSKELALEFSKTGAYFAFGGAVTFKNAKKQDIIKSIPIDRLLIETDCPYMSPVPKRGEVNEPKNVVYVYDFIAETLGIKRAELASIVLENSARLFKKLK